MRSGQLWVQDTRNLFLQLHGARLEVRAQASRPAEVLRRIRGLLEG
jgi:hypothetical protein